MGVAVELMPGSGEPDPGRVSTLEDFGRELTLARSRAGLTVRQVAREAGIPVSTAGDYFAGRHLPSAAQATTLRKILGSCGVSGPGQVDAWVQAAVRVRQLMGARPARAVVPYRGLAAFEAGDAGWFFGRDELIRLLTGVVAGGALGIPATVTGPSGAGKSSLLRAGLIPWLDSAPDREGVGYAWRALFTPEASPMTRLIAQVSDVMGMASGEAGAWLRALPRHPARPHTGTANGRRQDPQPGHMVNGLAGQPAQQGPARGVLVVDQFEEVFTACQDEGERQEFIGALSALAGMSLVVLGLRADFYGHALRYPELAASLQHRQVVVGPMTRDQIRQVIVEPARKAALTIDPGLPELLLNDLAPVTGQGQSAPYGHEAGSLPLLSHALLATWERGRRNQLTVADYLAAGGIRDAVARTAETAYATLSDEEKEDARRLFLRLVHVADDSPLTRATVPLAELQAWSPGVPNGVLARFVKHRLVTVDEDSAQITHEALLSAWPRLREWISADQEDLKVRDRIVSAARGWQESGRDDAVLLRGGPLAVAAEWAAQPANRDSLSLLARRFMDSALAHEQARVALERRRVGRLRRLVTALTVLVLVAGALAGYAFQQRHVATVARNQADSRGVAVEAGQIRGEDPSLAAQLSLAAFKISPTRGALASLLESAAYPAAARFHDSASVVESVALATGHRTLAVASADGTLRLWDVARPGHPVPFATSLTRSHGGPLYAAAFSPDGRVLAAAGGGRTIRLWDVATPQHPVPLGPPLTGPRNTVYSLAFSPDGRVLAAGSADGTIRLWDTSDPRHPATVGAPLTGPSGYVEAVAISPDGTILAAASADKTVRLWDISDPRHPVPLGRPLTGPAGIVDAVAFSPDGRTLAAGSRDNSVWLWNITDPAHPVRVRSLTNATDWVNAVAFSPDGRVLAAASSGDQVLLWNAATGALLATLPSPQPVTSLSWDGDHTLIAGGADGFVRLWTVPPPILLDSGPVNQVSFSPDGKLLAIAGPGLQLWDAATRTQVANATVPGAFANSVAWAPGGTVLATGSSDGMVRLWQWAHGHLSSLGVPLRAAGHGIAEFVIFRHGGQVLASTGDDGTVRLWNVADPSHPRPLAIIHDSATYVFSAAFSPGGKVLAAASADNLVRLWDVSDPARPRLLGTPLTGPASYAISVAFSPNGHILAVGSADHTVRLWNVTVPSRPHRIGAPLAGPGGYVYSVTFSPNGTTLAGGVTDGTIWLWNVRNPASPVLITHLRDALHPTGHVYTLAYSPNGATLAAGSSGGTVRLWDSRPPAAVAALCATAGQPLTRAEWSSYIPDRPYQPPCTRSGRR